MTTIDIELMDAGLNAPTGLDGLAADMADLAQREPTHDHHAPPTNPATTDAIHAFEAGGPPVQRSEHLVMASPGTSVDTSCSSA